MLNATCYRRCVRVVNRLAVLFQCVLPASQLSMRRVAIQRNGGTPLSRK